MAEITQKSTSLGTPFNHLKTWSIHQHHCGMLQAITALKFAQGATIDEGATIASLSTATHMVPLFFIPVQDSAAFSTAESCCSHLLCPSCCDGNLMVDTFCVQKFIEQDNLIKQIPSIVCESTDLILV